MPEVAQPAHQIVNVVDRLADSGSDVLTKRRVVLVGLAILSLSVNEDAVFFKSWTKNADIVWKASSCLLCACFCPRRILRRQAAALLRHELQQFFLFKCERCRAAGIGQREQAYYFVAHHEWRAPAKAATSNLRLIVL